MALFQAVFDGFCCTTGYVWDVLPLFLVTQSDFIDFTPLKNISLPHLGPLWAPNFFNCQKLLSLMCCVRTLPATSRVVILHYKEVVIFPCCICSL